MRAVKKMPPVSRPDSPRTAPPGRGLFDRYSEARQSWQIEPSDQTTTAPAVPGLSFDPSHLTCQGFASTLITRTIAVRDTEGLLRKPLSIAPPHGAA